MEYIVIRKNEDVLKIEHKMSSYQYRKSHCGDKTILWLSYLDNGISYTDKMTSLYLVQGPISI